MKKSIELKQDREKIRLAQKAITDLASTRTGANAQRMLESEATEWSKLEEDYNALTREIEIAEKMEARETKEVLDDTNNKSNRSKTNESGFAHFGEFMRAVRDVGMGNSRGTDERLFRAASGQNTSNPEEGGFLVGEEFLGDLTKNIFEASILAPLVKKFPISGKANKKTWRKVKDFGSRATGSRYGGARAYWLNEADQYIGSKVSFETGELKLGKIGAFAYLTDEQLEDGVDCLNTVINNISDETAFLIDEGIYSGSGAGQFLGVTNSKALISVAKEAGQPAGTIVFENVLKMRNRLLATSRKNSIWLINQDCEPQLQTMAFVVGAGGVPVYLPASGINTAGYDMLYGRPIVICEHSKTCGTKGDILLWDPTYYMMINKGQTKIDMSMHVRFDYGESAYRFTTRVNGMPMMEKPITPKEGSNTYSTEIVLDTRA